eukprot:scaffold12362_cov124-Isochrysis_galbana.AAC.11
MVLGSTAPPRRWTNLKTRPEPKQPYPMEGSLRGCELAWRLTIEAGRRLLRLRQGHKAACAKGGSATRAPCLRCMRPLGARPSGVGRPTRLSRRRRCPIAKLSLSGSGGSPSPARDI